MNDNFNIVVPFNFQKARDKKGNEVMRIGGIASTIQEDTDGEVLRPEGFNLKKLLGSGHINWNHKSSTDPDAVIGEIDFAKATNKDLYIEGNLYPDSEMAKKVYNLGKVLEKNSSTRRLGFSIEGRATKRNPQNPKEILEAELTGVAVTHVPKNGGTDMKILKSEELELLGSIVKSEDGNNYLIKEDGVVVDTGLNIIKGEVDKEDVKKDDDEKEKAITADGGDSGFSVTKPESVEGNPYNKEIDKKNKNKKKTFKKGEVYEEILGTITSDIEKAKEVFSIVEQISNMSKEKDISNETIEKARQILNLANDDTGTSKEEKLLTKAEETLKKAQDDLMTAQVGLDIVQKGGKDMYQMKKGQMYMKDKAGNMSPMDMEGDTYKNMEDGYYMKGEDGSYKAMDMTKNMDMMKPSMPMNATQGKASQSGVQTEMMGNEEGGKVDMQMNSMNMGNTPNSVEMPNPSIRKSEDDDIMKSISGLGDMLKEQTQALAQVVDNKNDDLQKSLDAIQSVTDNLKERLGKIEKSKVPGKSITGIGYQDKHFSDNINKSEDGPQGKTFSLSSNRAAAVNAMFGSLDFEKGNADQDIQKAIQLVEMTGSLGDEPAFSQRVQVKLKSKGISLVK
jgi:hypothetical protein